MPELAPRDERQPIPCDDDDRSLGAFLRRLVPDLLRVMILSTLIAAWLVLANHFGFWSNLIYSQAIGLSIFVLAVALSRLFHKTRLSYATMAVAVPVGCLAGLQIGSWITGDRLFSAHVPVGELLGTLGLAFVIGAVATYYFYARGLLNEHRARLQQAELERALDQKRLSDAQLKMLQAQIEPHFLFNTLSNVLNLIEDDPPRAHAMLADLTRLLRASLQRARLDRLPLSEELANLRAYVGIHAQRMGPRLRWSFEVDPDLESVLIPPYLLQPLVENAIRHGLEPQPAGGELRIGARREGETLAIEVADTGRGLQADHPPGVALANIRARLAALYQERAGLSLHPNRPSGVVARLRVPLAEQPQAA